MIVVFALFAGCAASSAPSGALRVVDADTFDIGGVRVRLHGIDAPEIGQPCLVDGVEWDCGAWARDRVADRFAGRQAVCSTVDIDRYGRVVATCTVGGRDLGAVLVSNGLAWAYRRYSDAYIIDEKAAAVAGRGLWGTEIDRAWDFRAAEAAPDAAPDPACAIKGNISANGRIFHLPENRDYARTSINTDKGERWFCSAREARAAGWRGVGE